MATPSLAESGGNQVDLAYGLVLLAGCVYMPIDMCYVVTLPSRMCVIPCCFCS